MNKKEKVVIVCRQCGKECEVNPCYINRKYCSRKCTTDSKRILIGTTIKCLICEKEFEPTYKEQKCCSAYCGNKYNNDKRIRTQTYICKQCGKEFLPKAADRTQYCSRECTFAYWKANPKPKKESIGFKHKGICVICGKEFVGKLNSKYCSDKCRERTWNIKRGNEVLIRERTCKQCGKLYSKTNNSQSNGSYCSSECIKQRDKDIHYNHKKERNIIIRKQHVKQVDRKAIYKRDNYICQICGLPVDMDMSLYHNLSPNIDHIIPLAKGGTHEPDNVQLTHRVCNQRKSIKIIRYKIYG